MIKEIHLSGSCINQYTFEGAHGKSRHIGPISTLNVFIGCNNSGKSRLLRHLFSDKNLTYLPSESGIDPHPRIFKLHSELNELVSKVIKEFPKENHLLQIREKLQKMPLPTLPHLEGNPWEAVRPMVESKVYNDIFEHALPAISKQAKDRYPEINEIEEFGNQVIDSYSNLQNMTNHFNFVYIPPLRSVQPFPSADDIFAQRVVDNYFPTQEERKNMRESLTRSIGSYNEDSLVGGQIFTGMQLYEVFQSHLLGNEYQRQSVRNFELFLQNKFFNGESVTLIPRKKEKVLHVKIGESVEQAIYDLGDGITQTIILTLPLFFAEIHQVIMFVEEPELYCHPGLQRLFIEAVLEKAQTGNLTVFVTTHSNHFLDTTLDSEQISVFRVSKTSGDMSKPDMFDITRVSNKEFELLEELGIRNSSVMLSNCTIWVEGITDRIYFRRYLEILQNEQNTHYQEDLHYSFVEYSGSNITHWSFLSNDIDDIKPIDVDRVCGKLTLIADMDNESKNERHKKLEKALGDRFILLRCKEVENLLSPQVIKNVVTSYELDSYKGENAESFSPDFNDFDRSAYSDVYLGKYIEDNAFKESYQRNRKGRYAQASGTLTDKIGFAKRAIQKINSSEDMSDEAIEITNRLLTFIKEQNN